MTTAERIEFAISLMQRIENKLDAWASTPQEVEQLRELIDDMRREQHQERETWRDILYRLLTNFAGLIKPKQNRGNIQPDDHEP